MGGKCQPTAKILSLCSHCVVFEKSVSQVHLVSRLHTLQISPAEWRSYTSAIQPDFALALSDTPFTNPPYSQKRLTKSVERSHAWLANFIRPSPYDTLAVHTLVHMAGGTSIPARRAFANGLVETLFGAEADSVQPLKCLDEGVTGYVFDSVPLHIAIAAASQRDNDKPVDAVELVPLIQSSLTSLPLEKPRIVMSSSSPQEMLTLILSCGIDLFDAQWAQRAADIGVALDFTFPISKKGPPLAENGKRSLGHNLYDTSYAQDFSRLAETFAGEANRGEEDLVCPCIACSPCSISTPIPHSSIDSFAPPLAFNPSTSRAYVHHLLHTHEMSAHALLAAHNVNVLDAMFAGVRKVAQASKEDFEKEVQLFLEHYDGSLWVFKEAASSWKEVDLARGKGRLAREKLREVGDAQI